MRHHSVRYARQHEADGQARRERTAARPARHRRSHRGSPGGKRSEPDRQGRDDRGANAKQHHQIDGDHDGIGGAGDESGSAGPQADGGGRAEQHAGEDADAQAGGQRKRGGPRVPRWRRRARSDRRGHRDSRARAAARAAPSTRESLSGEPGARSHRLQNRRSATNSRQLVQAAGAPPERRERGDGGRTELGGEIPRAVDAAERDERRLACVGRVDLAGLGRRAGDVEQVVDDLKRQAEVLRVRAECRDVVRRCRRRSARRRWPPR